MRIAVCDDIKETLDFLCAEIDRQFSAYGIEHSISKFENGRAFIAVHEKEPFDAAFLDIDMPETNGFDVCYKYHNPRLGMSNKDLLFLHNEIIQYNT